MFGVKLIEPPFSDTRTLRAYISEQIRSNRNESDRRTLVTHFEIIVQLFRA